MKMEHAATQTGQKTSLRSAQVFINQTGRIKEVSPLSYDALFPQAVNLFGVIAKLAQPHVRVLGKGRRGSLRRRFVLGKKKTAAGYFLFSGGSFKFRDELAPR